MSTQPPPTSAERLAARQSSSASIARQLIVLGMGMGGAAVIAGVLGKVTGQTNPIWVLPVIASGFLCFFGWLATTAWTMRAAVGQTVRPAVTGGIYLTSVLLVAGVVAYAGDVPRAAYLTPLASRRCNWVSEPLARSRTTAGRVRRHPHSQEEIDAAVPKMSARMYGFGVPIGTSTPTSWVGRA